MTKKHFKAFASAIAEITNDEIRLQTADRIGAACARLNPLFDWQKWDEACEVSKLR